MWANSEKIDVKSKIASSYDERLLNPKGFGGVDSNGRIASAKGDMFNSKGEMNAYDNKEVLDNQVKFAGLRDKYQKTGSFYTQEQKQQIVEAAFSGDAAERQRFGAEMIPLILDRLDYEGFIRKVLKTHEVSQGQIISYEKDVNVAAYMIQEDGQTIESVIKGNRVFPSEFWVTAFEKIGMAEIAKRQYDVVDRAHDKAAFQIQLAEDRNGLRQLYQAATTYNTQINITSTVNKSVLETIAYEVERWRLKVDKFLMNRQELGDLRKVINSMDYDPITSRDTLLTGVFASIWGYNIFVSAGVDEQGIQSVSVPAGMIFAVTAPRYLGAMPIRIGLTMLPADQFMLGQFNYGFLFGEYIGQTVLNSRSISMGVKTSSTVPAWMSN